MSSNYKIDETKDNKKILTINCTPQDLYSCFSAFCNENPGLRPTRIIQVDISHGSTDDTYACSFELGDNPDNKHHPHLFRGSCRTSENPEQTFNNLIKTHITDECIRKKRYYSFIPHKMQHKRIKDSKNSLNDYLVLSDIIETEKEFEGVTVPPSEAINIYLKDHPELRLIGLCNGDEERREAPSWASKSGTYQKHYSVTALFASIKDFPELAKIKSQGVLALVDHPSNSIESQTESLLKKRNAKTGMNHTTSEYVVALKYPIGETFLDQENDNGNVTMTLQDGSSRTIAGYCDQYYIVINEQERQIASPIIKQPETDDRLVHC